MSTLMPTGRVYPRQGKWWVDYKDPQRGRIRRPVAPTKAEAKATLAKILTELREKGIFEVKAPYTTRFEDMAQEYLTWSRANKRSWRADEGILRQLGRTFNARLLAEITHVQVEQYKSARREAISERTCRPLSPRRVNYELAVLKALFNKAILWDKADGNPVRRVKFLVENNARTRMLDDREAERLLAACAAGPGYLKPFVTVALFTGMRLGEILALKWADVDYAHGLILLRTSKNGKGRTLPMAPPAREALRACVSVEGVTSPNDGYVFAGKGRGPRKSIKTAFVRAVERAGLRDFRFHDLRHTFASRLANQGTDLLVIKELLGHKTLAMTLRYSHLLPNRGRQAVDQLSARYGARTATTVAPGTPS